MFTKNALTASLVKVKYNTANYPYDITINIAVTFKIFKNITRLKLNLLIKYI